MPATPVAAVTGYSAYWIGQIARRYNTHGPDGVRDRRHTMCAGRSHLPDAQLGELQAAVAGPHPDGDRWCGRTVAAWLSQRLGRQVGRQLGCRSLRRLAARWRKPRPRHIHTAPAAQPQLLARLPPLLRPATLAPAFARATAA